MLFNKFAVTSVILEEDENSFLSEVQTLDHSLLVETIGFLYDIPKLECFSNKSLTEFIQENGFKDCKVQIIKDEDRKPFWSGRVKFSSADQLQKACVDLKYFQMKGYQIRLLSYDQNLVNSKTLPVSKTPSCKKPDNSEEKCNLVVKGLYPSMTDKDLEEFFANKYGPVQNSKIAKDIHGKSKGYGFVWFKEGRHANAAMLDFKCGKIPFILDWYKILAQRKIETLTLKPEFDQIQVTWKPTENNYNSIPKQKIINYFQKFGKIVFVEFRQNRASIRFSSTKEAEFAVLVPKIDLYGFMLNVRAADPNEVIAKECEPEWNVIIKKLKSNVSEHQLSELLQEFGPFKMKIMRNQNMHSFALVQFQDPFCAQQAVRNLKHEFFLGAPIFIETFRRRQSQYQPHLLLGELRKLVKELVSTKDASLFGSIQNCIKSYLKSLDSNCDSKFLALRIVGEPANLKCLIESLGILNPNPEEDEIKVEEFLRSQLKKI